jgi:hypothetical protein
MTGGASGMRWVVPATGRHPGVQCALRKAQGLPDRVVRVRVSVDHRKRRRHRGGRRDVHAFAANMTSLCNRDAQRPCACEWKVRVCVESCTAPGRRSLRCAAGRQPNVRLLLGVRLGERVGERCEEIDRAESLSQVHRVRRPARLPEGEKMAPLCAEFGISRRTGYKTFDRYKDCGLYIVETGCPSKEGRP